MHPKTSSALEEEINGASLGEPEIFLVSPVTDVAKGQCDPSCTPSLCSPNVACDPNTSCHPFNCQPAVSPCMPECAPATPCRPTGILPCKPG